MQDAKREIRSLLPEELETELKALKAEQAEADKARLIEAFEASGKSIDEVIAMIKTE